MTESEGSVQLEIRVEMMRLIRLRVYNIANVICGVGFW